MALDEDINSFKSAWGTAPPCKRRHRMNKSEAKVKKAGLGIRVLRCDLKVRSQHHARGINMNHNRRLLGN